MSKRQEARLVLTALALICVVGGVLGFLERNLVAAVAFALGAVVCVGLFGLVSAQPPPPEEESSRPRNPRDFLLLVGISLAVPGIIGLLRDFEASAIVFTVIGAIFLVAYGALSVRKR